jgi:hypothetical protein
VKWVGANTNHNVTIKAIIPSFELKNEEVLKKLEEYKKREDEIE